MDAYAIELYGLSKRFGEVQAVADAHLVIEPGELVALVGPSGCGKTTLLRMIAGFERPDAGDILLSGRSVIHEEPEQRRVGIVFQDYALFPHMSVAENIGYGLKFTKELKRTERQHRVEELLELVGLSGYGNRQPHELSAGQQQRVALARALAPTPTVLLLDEPMSALDALLREELRQEIRGLQRELHITTVHVTHDQEEALSIADRVAVMRDGKLLQVGHPEELYFRPNTEFVAHFIGRGNLLHGKVAAIDGETVDIRFAPDQLVRVPAPSSRLRVGEEATLLIRPDRLVCGATGCNTIQGEVRAIEFLGEISRVRVSVGKESLLIVVDSRDASAWRRRIGGRVDLTFRQDDGWLIPGNG